MKKKSNDINNFDPVFTSVPNKYSSKLHDFNNSMAAITHPVPGPNPDTVKTDKAAHARWDRNVDFRDWELNDANYR